MNDDHETLPPRRSNRTIECMFYEFRFQLLVGYYSDGRIGEVTFAGPRRGSALCYIVADACAIISELLQRYVSIETLTELVGRTEDGGAESIIGEIILQLAQSP